VLDSALLNDAEVGEVSRVVAGVVVWVVVKDFDFSDSTTLVNQPTAAPDYQWNLQWEFSQRTSIYLGCQVPLMRDATVFHPLMSTCALATVLPFGILGPLYKSTFGPLYKLSLDHYYDQLCPQ
jgi:hypothetical protein